MSTPKTPAGKRAKHLGAVLGGVRRLDPANTERIAAIELQLSMAKTEIAIEDALDAVFTLPAAERAQIIVPYLARMITLVDDDDLSAQARALIAEVQVDGICADCRAAGRKHGDDHV